MIIWLAAGLLLSQVGPTDQQVLGTVAWNVLNAVPAVGVTTAFGWQEPPLRDYSALMGWVLLAVRSIVVLGLVTMAVGLWRSVSNRFTKPAKLLVGALPETTMDVQPGGRTALGTAATAGADIEKVVVLPGGSGIGWHTDPQSGQQSFFDGKKWWRQVWLRWDGSAWRLSNDGPSV